ncbi:hypothetical protein LPJ72_004850 [Coemansia sp. Benny D160-2]|nr:hypothetical protein LPJ72_004850 [Coemansia sp. Benny D160-2]
MASEVDRLLSQIRSETARELFESRQGLVTGIQPIDEAIAEAGRSSTDAALIECVGAPGSGKTHVLWHICAMAAMPQAELGGANRHVLLVDIDGRADLWMLAQHMEGVYGEAMRSGRGENGGAEEARRATEAAVREALGRVHLFSPDSTSSLIATLALVPKYLAERQIRGRVVLLIDGLGSNYGFERKEATHVRMASKSATPWFRTQQTLVATIQRLHQHTSCLTVATSLLMLPAAAAAAGGSSQEHARSDGTRQRTVRLENGELFRDHMIPRWLNVVSGSFVLEKTASEPDRSPTAISIAPIDSHSWLTLTDKRLLVRVGDHGLLLDRPRPQE